MSFISYLINGISLGSVYAIIALGYTMVYGIAKMLNFAHGDVIMIGAYVVMASVTRAGIPPFAVRRNVMQARGFTAEQLKQALQDGAELEEAVKTGRMNDQMAVELFLVRYSAVSKSGSNKKTPV